MRVVQLFAIVAQAGDSELHVLVYWRFPVHQPYACAPSC
jgi:hypothetical protein